MKPISISLKNYKSYGDNETTLKLDVDSIRLIVGKSGSGKTSIIDAIIWCLYGKCLSNADEVVNRQTKKNCKIEFIFQVGTDIFSVIRYRKHDENGNKVLVFKNNKNISPVKITDAQQLVQDIIEISANSLVSSVIFSSEIYSSFMREKNSVRLSIFEGILSLRQINKWNETTKKLLKPITTKLLENEGKKSTAEQVSLNIQDNIDKYKEGSIEKLKGFKEEKERIALEIGSLERERKDIEVIDIDKELLFNGAFYEREQKNERTSDELSKFRSKKSDTNNLLVKLNNIKNDIEKLNNIDTENYTKEYEEYKAIIDKNEKLELEIQLKKTQYINKKELEDKELSLKDDLEKLQKEVRELEFDATCPTCHQKLPEELQNELGLIKIRKQTIIIKETELNDLLVNSQSAEETNNILDGEIRLLTSQMAEVEDKEFKFTPDQIKNMEQKKTENILNLKVLEKEFEEKDRINIELDIEIKEKEKELVENDIVCNYDTFYLENLSVRVEEIKKEIREKNNKIEIINEKAKSAYDINFVKELEGKRERLKVALKKLVKELEKQEFEERHFKYLLNLFSNKEGGLKKVIIGQMIEVFIDEVNKYLPLFFDEAIEISFDKNLTETIKVDNIEVSFSTFSSGEKTRFEFAVAFSLFMLVKSFFSKDVSFIVFDEILDMNLDEESLEKVLAVVQELGASNSILVISHRTELKDIFINHIYVSKDKNGMSIVKEAS